MLCAFFFIFMWASTIKNFKNWTWENTITWYLWIIDHALFKCYYRLLKVNNKVKNKKPTWNKKDGEGDGGREDAEKNGKEMQFHSLFQDDAKDPKILQEDLWSQPSS